ncbi:mitochondrial fission ELM1 family protein [Acinetobacter sp. ME22]|uniref:ELM1/GtrOC1 family putative glycosyltransferase n=1 Tax=Acinetobacter sp. ME22 TaxID=2904802 RepID=UPI001EDB5E38|nr:ELM1/GtrOC1 family putative glycosyltransferase [Acinetobacter sp. ME22]MCG2573609.1 mitochondrial fission ELM1 family protein [Acinetobacter sp. ME22]
MHDQQNTKKTVWVISDGVPGHFNQSKGVLFALERDFELDVHWIELTLKHKFYRRPLTWLLNCKIPKAEKIHQFYQGDALPSGRPDIVIGAGGNSAYAIVWLSKALDAKNIFCGSLRQLKAELFDAILVLEPDLPKPFINLPVSPMPLSQATLAQHATVWRSEHPHVEQPVWTMLIGGDGAGAQYQQQDWVQLAKQMNLLARQHRIKWLLSTSRRTGQQAEKILQQYLNFEGIADVVWWSEQPRSVLHQFLAVSTRVFCSADSMSMMMESVTAMRPVVAYLPEHWQPDEKFQNVLQRLSQQQLLQVISIAQLNSTFKAEQQQTLAIEPSEMLAGQLHQQLFVSD